MDKHARQSCDVVIFGANGDLTQKKLLPSLYRLEAMKFTHPRTRIICVGRAPWNTQDYIDMVRRALDESTDEPIRIKTWNAFRARLRFCSCDVNQSESFGKLARFLDPHSQTVVYYFAVPSRIYSSICDGLQEFKLNTKRSRVVVEKPIGIDIDSFNHINDRLTQLFQERQIYRIDHYLGKESVLNLFVLRFANSIFRVNWGHETIDHVQITVAEEVGIEKRWNYFDKVGQMRDMVQSHLLQILTLVAMSPPKEWSMDCVRDEKVKILRALRPIDSQNFRSRVVRGQYTRGFVHGKKVAGYSEEKNADACSRTETFVAFRVDIDHRKWINVPFYLRTGKRMAAQISEVVVYFKHLTPHPFSKFPQCVHRMVIPLQTDKEMTMDVLHRKPGWSSRHRLEKTTLRGNFSTTTDFLPNLDAHTRLLWYSMQGKQTFFVRKDEIEESWKWINRITQAWECDDRAPDPYRSGTWGPENAARMMRRDGRSWNV